jgi:twitching motility protein PilT
MRIFKAKSIKDVPFSDIWLTPEKIAYIRDNKTKFALIPFETEDLSDFEKVLDQGYTGSASYAIRYQNESYRVERVVTTTGIQYNCRKMPVTTPSICKLGLPDPIVKYMTSLATESGLILLAGPTGMGKTTTVSALAKEFLETHGGFLYTIEDPPEMPLDGLYPAKNGGLGLCKQSPVENERWGEGLKSALRSRPRYILVGEIRTPEVASQALRAATSGHLVLSTIHANSVEDALNSMIKYATGAGLDEKLVCDLLARGILGVVHQQLEGTTTLRPVIHTAFANPNPMVACQMRMTIREGKISLATFMEAQNTRLFQGRPMFREL